MHILLHLNFKKKLYRQKITQCSREILEKNYVYNDTIYIIVIQK